MAFAKPYQPRSRTRLIPQRDACQNREETTVRSVKTWKGGGERCGRELMEGIPNERLGLKKENIFCKKNGQNKSIFKIFHVFLPSQSEGSTKSNYSANRPRRWILRNKGEPSSQALGWLSEGIGDMVVKWSI